MPPWQRNRNIMKEGPMTNLRNKYIVKLKEKQQSIDKITELTLLKSNLVSLRIKLKHSPKGTKPKQFYKHSIGCSHNSMLCELFLEHKKVESFQIHKTGLTFTHTHTAQHIKK